MKMMIKISEMDDSSQAELISRLTKKLKFYDMKREGFLLQKMKGGQKNCSNKFVELQFNGLPLPEVRKSTPKKRLLAKKQAINSPPLSQTPQFLLVDETKNERTFGRSLSSIIIEKTGCISPPLIFPKKDSNYIKAMKRKSLCGEYEKKQTPKVDLKALEDLLTQKQVSKPQRHNHSQNDIQTLPPIIKNGNDANNNISRNPNMKKSNTVIEGKSCVQSKFAIENTLLSCLMKQSTACSTTPRSITKLDQKSQSQSKRDYLSIPVNFPLFISY